MSTTPISIQGDIHFKIRFNTTHGDTDLYWRVIIDGQEYLANTVHAHVATYSDASFDTTAHKIKYHMAGTCKEFIVDEARKAIFK